MWLRAVLLMISSVAVGALSGALYPATMAPRGAILGGCLALATLVLDRLSAIHQMEGLGPRWRWVLPIGAASGLLAGGLCWGFFPVPATPELWLGFPPDITPDGWPTLLVGLAYGVVLQATYAWRWRMPLLLPWTPWLVGAGGLAVAIGRDFWLHGTDDPLSSLLAALCTGVPLAAGWALCCVFFDPAFTVDRWRRHGRHYVRPPTL